jgi:NitT/TauT family transport system substrate-binding protein
MCDRHVNRSVTDLGSASDPARAATTANGLDRRSFLKASAAGTIVMAMPGMMGFSGSAHAAATVKGTHGNGFCNATFFITHMRQLAKEDGLTIAFVNTPSFAGQVTFLGTGEVDVSVLPYTNFMALYDAGAAVKIVAGGGVQGVYMVAQPGLDTPAKLKGKTLGTFQNDTLEVLPYDWLKKNGVSYKDVTVRYMDSMGEMVAAFKAGAVDIATTIEPYGSAILNDVKGSVLLSDGVDIYGPDYTDCILAASTRLIEKDPKSVKALIKAMLKAQLMFEQDREKLLAELVGTYYKTSLENARIGAKAQPAKVDQRAQTDFILNRVDSVMAMGYIKKKPGRDAIDWSLLEQAIAELPEVYAKLEHKSA